MQLELDCPPGSCSTFISMVSQSLFSCSFSPPASVPAVHALLGLLWAAWYDGLSICIWFFALCSYHLHLCHLATTGVGMVFVRPHFYSNCSCRVHKTRQTLLKMLHFETFYFVVVLRLTTPSVYLLLVQKIHSCRHSPQSFSPTLIYEIPSATGMCCQVKTLRAVAVDS